MMTMGDREPENVGHCTLITHNIIKILKKATLSKNQWAQDILRYGHVSYYLGIPHHTQYFDPEDMYTLVPSW